MKKIRLLLALFVVVFIGNQTIAQPPGGNQQTGQRGPKLPNDEQIEKMVTDLSQQLSISEKIETEVLALYKEHFKEVKEKVSNETRPNKEEMDALKTDFENEVKALLTEDQKVKYDAFVRKNQPRHERPQRKQ